MPQNAWKLLFKFKRISLKRCIMFKQSFYLLAHWMQEWHLFIISTRGWSKKIKSIVNCGDMQPWRRSRNEKIQWLILGILCKLFILWDGMFMPSRPKWSIDAIDRKVWPHSGGFPNYNTVFYMSKITDSKSLDVKTENSPTY